MAVKKRRRAATSPIDRANQKTDEEFVSSYLKPGAADTAPWITRWTHPKTGAAYDLSLTRSGHVGEEALEACFALIEETSRGDYEKSAQGWRPGHKRREMREVDLRYILVRESTEDGSAGQPESQPESQPEAEGERGDEPDDERKANGQDDQPSQKRLGAIQGFTSLMPTYEEGQPVVYCYEIHLKPELRGTGLSTVLLGFLYTVAYNLPPISKVMLTCFLSNERALRFYGKQGFAADEVSPEARTLRGKTFMPDYTIMSKSVVR